MELIIGQLYDFAIGVLLGALLSFFYSCYRFILGGNRYSRYALLIADSLWWLFAGLITIGCLFWLQMGHLRFLFFVAFVIGFAIGYCFLWRPLIRKMIPFWQKKKVDVEEISRKGKASFGFDKEKKSRWVEQPFDFTAQKLYKGFSYGKGQYQTLKKKKDAATVKWKKQLKLEKQKWQQKLFTALWPKEKEPPETEDSDDLCDDFKNE